MAFVVGQKVRVKDLESLDHSEFPDIVEEMYEYSGKEYEVASVEEVYDENLDDGTRVNIYTLEGVRNEENFFAAIFGGDNSWNFSENWLEEA